MLLIERATRRLVVRDPDGSSDLATIVIPAANMRGRYHLSQNEAQRRRDVCRAAGFDVYMADTRTCSEYVPPEEIQAPAPAPIAETITYRGVTPQYIGDRKQWRYQWQFGGQTVAVTGATPEEVIQKIFDPSIQATSPALRNLVASLPGPELPTAPVTQDPTPAIPGKILRPGSNESGWGLPPRPVQQATTQQNIEVEWRDFVNNPYTSTIAIKERAKKDPAFAQWVNKEMFVMDTNERKG